MGQPYPYYYSNKSLTRLTGVIFLLCFCFVFFFQPFNVEISEHRMHYALISFIHAGLASLIFYSYFSLINLTGIKEDNWNLGKEIIHLGLVLVIIGLGNFLIRDLIYDNPGNWSFTYFLEELNHTFLVGILLILLLVPLNFMRKYHQNSKAAAKWKPTHSLPHNEVPLDTVQINTKVKADDFQLIINEFLYARAEGNYVEFHLEGNRKLLKRLPMKVLEDQLKDFPKIVKTHRSFLVNTTKIIAVSGNAQGYQLKVRDHPSTIPVARGMVPAFLAANN